LCESPRLTQFLDLGFTPPADQFITAEKLNEPETHYPLRVLRCDHCMFVQLGYIVPPEILYQSDYPYESSTTLMGRDHFDEFAEHAVSEGCAGVGDLVVDIGSNVGVLLRGFGTRGCRILGFDPAKNIAAIAESRGVPTIPDFFTVDTASAAAARHGRARIVTGSNVFAHVDDLRGFMAGVDRLLAEDGILIIEAPYLANLVSNLEYDTIYHEHLSYLSLAPLIPFFQRCGFELFDVRQVDIHGGSFRLFMSRIGKKGLTDRLLRLVDKEFADDLHSMRCLMGFAKRVEHNRDELARLLGSLRADGARIAGVSAPAKGMTLLNYNKIGSETLEFLTEKSELKIGKYAPGSHLEILPDSALMERGVECALLLAWNFKTEIMRNLSSFRERGGRFIIPIPYPTLI
jgi:SAM-dependent methyltransferase